MCLRLCHGILGEELLELQEDEQHRCGWDLMLETARHLNLPCPFQVVIYSQATSKIQRPLHQVQVDPEQSDTTYCYIVQQLQTPTVDISHELLAAIAKRDMDKVTQLLGCGLDLSGPDTTARPISTLLAAAVLSDHCLTPTTASINHEAAVISYSNPLLTQMSGPGLNGLRRCLNWQLS